MFARVHPTKNFPHFSLVFIGVLAVAFSFLPLGQVIDGLLVTRILVQFMGQIGAVLWLRRTQPELKRPFRMWLFPLPALVALAGWIFLFSTSGLTTVLYAVSVVVIGIVCFFIRDRMVGNQAKDLSAADRL